MKQRLKDRKELVSVLASIFSIIMIFGLVTFYLNQLNDYIYSNTVQNIEELAAHDIENVQYYLNDVWNTFFNLGEKIRAQDFTDKNEMEKYLELEAVNSNFESICVLDDTGNLYCSDFSTEKMDNKYYETQFMMSDSDKTVVRISYNHKAQTLMYGVKIDPVQIGDMNAIAIFGYAKISSVEKSLRIESFNGKGYSVVFDKDGDMVANINRSDLTLRENFYKQLSESEIEGDYTVDDLRELNNNNESYVMKYTDINGIEKVFYSAPVKDTPWTFVIIVPYNIFVQQSSDIMSTTMWMLVIIISTLVAVVLIIYSLSKSVMKSRLEAKAKGDFLSNMSHEIRTPLNGIIGLNHLMMAHIDDKEKMKVYLSKNMNTAEYLLSLVNDILDMSKLQAEKVEIVNNPFYLDEMVDDICSMQNSAFDVKNVSLVVEKQIDYPYISGDVTRIEQVIMNVLSNAVKFTPEGGETRFTITQECDRISNAVETTFVIADNGCGMSKEFQEKIFDSFSQERSKNPNSIKGTGLGMSISYMLMKLMGGSISVESELGVGSTFTIVLPSEICIEEQAEQAEEHYNIKDKGNLNILLAEDNELNAEILTEILGDEGISVTVAVDGEQAVEMFAQSEINEFDIILMDIQMPKLNGYDACRNIRALNRADAQSVLVFACTANAFSEDKDKAIECGMNDFITKPIDVNELFRKLGY